MSCVLWFGCVDVEGPDAEAVQTSAASNSPVEQGRRNFMHTLPSGNGRSCASCHVEALGFALTPAFVEGAFDALPIDAQGRKKFESDPLFASIDANDFASDFSNLRNGLVGVNITLAPNVSVDELPGQRTIRLFRSVPTVWNVALTAPYQIDMRASTLQEQAIGAQLDHMRPQRLSTGDFLDTLAAFQRDQFSSECVRAFAAQLANGENVTRAECGPLTAEQLEGRDAFNFRCTQCHGGPNLAHGPVARFVSPTLDVSVSRLNRVGLPVFTFRFQRPDGSEVVRRSPDPGRALISGNPERGTSFEAFDIPTLYGIRHTAPYFHDNSAPTLEAVMQHYQEDFAFAKANGVPDPAVQTPFTDEEMRLIIEYMKTL